MHGRPLRTLLLIAFLLAALLAAGAASGRGLVRVREGDFATTGGRLLSTGWHLVSPLTAVRILSQEGEGALPPLPAVSREGVMAEARLSFHYRVRMPELEEQLRVRQTDFHRLLEQAAAEALSEVVSPRSAVELLDQSALDPLLSESLTRVMGKAGLEISSLRWEIRLPEAFRTTALRSQVKGLARETGIRILLIGLDGADWESVDPILAEGRLPNLARLIRTGVRGPLRSYNPMISPLLWTTLATGKGPDIHGVADFTVSEARTGKRAPISSRYRRVKTLWNILSDLDRRSAVVGWWASYPADHVQGYLVSDRVAALSLLPGRENLARQSGYSYPADYLQEVLPRLGRPRDITLEDVRAFADVTPTEVAAGLDWIAHPPEPPREKKEEKPPVQDPVGLLLKILAVARNYQTIAEDLLSRGPFDLAAFYFEGIDLVGHRFQHYRPPKMAMVGAEEYARYHRVVSEFYVYQDRLLGELVRKAGEGTTVLVVSDHGFKTGDRRPEGILPYTVDQPVEWHREDGILVLSGPGAARGALREPATLFDVAPTVLALLGAPVPSDMPGHVLREALDPAFLRRFPPRSFPTYEGLGDPRRTEEEGESDEVSAEMMAQLRALGYVGGESPPARATGESAAMGDEASGDEETTVSYHRNLATYYLTRRNYEKAIRELLEANRRQKLPKSYAMLAEAYDALGRKQEALAALEEGWIAVPEAMADDSILWYVQMAVDTGDPARGRRFLEDHHDRLPDAPAVRDAAAGVLAETEGSEEEAVRLYEAALSADPTLVAAARPLASIYAREGRLEALRPILEAGLARSERIDEYHNLLGALESRAGRKEQALAHFRRASELNPTDPRFALNLGLTLMDLERWDEAAEVLQRAAAGSQNGDVHLALGNVRLQQGRPDTALEAFRFAGRLGADPARADLGTALSFLAMKQRDEALSLLRESPARRTGDPSLQRLYQDLQARERGTP